MTAYNDLRFEYWLESLKIHLDVHLNKLWEFCETSVQDNVIKDIERLRQDITDHLESQKVLKQVKEDV